MFRIGIIGAGHIAEKMAATINGMPEVEAYAVAARQYDRAAAFAARFGASDMKWDDETGPGDFYYDSVAVDPSYRGSGIGSALFDAMDRRAAELGFDVAGLLVDLDNPAAERLYERLGFRTVGEKDFFGHRMKHKQKSLK